MRLHPSIPIGVMRLGAYDRDSLLAAARPMSFRFDLESDPDPIYRDETGASIIEFSLGYDLDENKIVVMSVMLVPTDNPEVLELCFGIREKFFITFETTLVSAPDYSKEGTDKYIPRASRSMVHALIGDAIAMLLPQRFPKYITMQTFYAHLPNKAMKKYEGICGRVLECGYELADAFRDETDGVNYWLFTKLG
jgi:hypothetical protein